jgi:hypothetical protein
LNIFEKSLDEEVVFPLNIIFQSNPRKEKKFSTFSTKNTIADITIAHPNRSPMMPLDPTSEASPHKQHLINWNCEVLMKG